MLIIGQILKRKDKAHVHAAVFTTAYSGTIGKIVDDVWTRIHTLGLLTCLRV